MCKSKNIPAAILVFLLSIVCAMSSAAAPLTARQKQDVIGKINSATAGMKSMTCSFTQTKHLSMLSDKMVSEGRMYYRQSGRLRWEYTSPYQYLFVLNGTKVYVGGKSRKDVIDTSGNRIFKEIARIMMSTVTGTALSSSSDFSVDVADGKSVWLVTLVPAKKEMKKMFTKIVLSFAKSDLLISEINIHEKNSDRTNIKLKNVKINGTVNDSLFAIPK